MQNEPSRLVFDFEVNIEMSLPPSTSLGEFALAIFDEPPLPPRPPRPPQQPPIDKPPDIGSIVYHLNNESEEIADEIQKEIRKLLPRCNTQVIISFYEGSLIALGTAVLMFLGPIVAESARQALKPELTRLLQFAIKRVLTRGLNRMNLLVSAPMEVDVRPSPTNTKDGEIIKTKEDDASPPRKNLITPRFLMPLTVANAVLLLILLILLISIAIPHLRIIP